MGQLFEAYFALHPFLQIVLGSLALTWVPAGAAGSSVIFAVGARHQPENFLRHYGSNVVGFWMTIALGWICILCLIILTRSENKFSGLAIPGRRAREAAQRALQRRVPAAAE